MDHHGLVRLVHRNDRELYYQGEDELGFGRAIDTETGKDFLLNQDTFGYDRESLNKHPLFMAKITPTYYVVAVTQIFGLET